MRRDLRDGLRTGGSHVETVTITDPSVPLRATVVWVDAPQSALVNDLDLTVVGPGGTPAERFGAAVKKTACPLAPATAVPATCNGGSRSSSRPPS